MPPNFKFTCDEIVDAAFAIVRRSGWSALTTRAVADALGASARPIYSFFSSVSELEEEVVRKAVDLLRRYMTRRRTGDPWHDHGIGYVLFALEEKALFRAVTDERHVAIFKKYGDVVWETLTSALAAYPPFQGLSSNQVFRIQFHRWLLAHGLAFAASNPPPDTWTRKKIVAAVREGSDAIYQGLRQQFETHRSSKGIDMKKRDPIQMALQIAGLRANETHLPESERVFEDPYAEFFLPEDIRKLLKDPVLVKAERAKYERIMPGVNGAIVARIRYIDECLADAIRNGLQQMVIIGAGFDTRAYRIPGVRENLKVFEVDHPTTQNIKMRAVREIFGHPPEHVAFVPMVFGKDRLEEQLSAHGCDASLRTLYIIEGLLMYIAAPAVEALLTFIGKASAPGSSFVADYFDSSVVDGTSMLPEAQALKGFVEQQGASLEFGIDEDGVEAYLRARGFSAVETINATALKKKFFPAAGPDRRVSPMFNFVTATV